MLVQEQKADGLIIIGRLTGEYLKLLNEKQKFRFCIWISVTRRQIRMR